MKVETAALGIKTIGEMYGVNGKHFNDLYKYGLMSKLRNIYNSHLTKEKAKVRLNECLENAKVIGLKTFNVAVKTMKPYLGLITNFFNRRSTNASAESFNSKIKIFRTQLQGIRDNTFFIFRLVKLFA